MAFCPVLLADRLAGLIILVLEITVFPEEIIAVFFPLLCKIQRCLPPLVNEIFGKLQMFFILCHLIESHKGHLRYLMTGISGFLTGRISYIFINTIYIANGCVQKFPFSGCLIIGYSTFHHMTQAVELVVIHKVCKAFFQTIQNIIGVQIPVRLLCRTDDINGLIRRCLQLLVRMPHERVGHSLQPLIGITVLKYHSLKTAFLHTSGNTEILNTVTGLRPLDPVI